MQMAARRHATFSIIDVLFCRCRCAATAFAGRLMPSLYCLYDAAAVDAAMPCRARFAAAAAMTLFAPVRRRCSMPAAPAACGTERARYCLPMLRHDLF